MTEEYTLVFFFFDPEDSLHYWYKSATLDLYLASPDTTKKFLITAAKNTKDTKSEEHAYADGVSYYLRDLKRYSEYLVRRLQILDQVGIVVRILHHVHQLHDVRIFVPMRLFREKAAWVHQAHDTEQLNLFYMMIGFKHHEKQNSCT